MADDTTQNATTDSSTLTAQASVAPVAEKQGEVVIDKAANSPTTNDNEQTLEENVADAQSQALLNHAVEHANDPTNSADKTAV